MKIDEIYNEVDTIIKNNDPYLTNMINETILKIKDSFDIDDDTIIEYDFKVREIVYLRYLKFINKKMCLG